MSTRYSQILPRITSQVAKLFRERQKLHFEGQGHLEVRVCFAVPNKVEQLCRFSIRVEVVGRIVWVNIFSVDLEVRLGHLRERPGCRLDHALQKKQGVSPYIHVMPGSDP